uniref:Fe2OG dioxygenase domain-containing protein n=1 Tax=Picea sitchensis TaxID=3332 RepID=A9P021_PICSI|nr:unknown [Picea sitchensis]
MASTALPPTSLNPYQQTHEEKEQQYPVHYRGVKDLVDNGSRTLPQIYVRPPDERLVINSHQQQIPLIDLSELEGAGRSATVEAIGRACRDWGFFLVKNHGVSESTMENEMRVGREFFHLPTEEKMRYFSTDHKSRMRYATSFNVKEDKTLNWRDFLRYSFKPLEEMVPLWPDKPTDFRKENAEYIRKIGDLASILLSAISESLGLPSEYINEVYGDYSQYMAYNFYPACPNPEQTLGIQGHSDPGGLILLMQDDVGGLQVLHEDHWVVVRPVPNTLVINLGNQLQILSNDIYKSVEHRAVVNSNKERISVATAYGPSMSTLIAPAPQLVNSSSPAVYKGCVYGDFLDSLQSGSLHKKSVLDCLKLDMS